jgi:hypothetical protein
MNVASTEMAAMIKAEVARMFAAHNPISSRTNPNFNVDWEELAFRYPPPQPPQPVPVVALDIVKGSNPASPTRVKAKRARATAPPAPPTQCDGDDVLDLTDSPASAGRTTNTTPKKKRTGPSTGPSTGEGGVSSSRGVPTRSKPSSALLQRFSRAFKHPIYLIARLGPLKGPPADIGCKSAVFSVQGASGLSYTVSVCRRPTCTCPDFVKRARGESGGGTGACKHLLFVMNRVLKVDKYDPTLYQVILMDEELTRIFSEAPPEHSGIDPALMADPSVLAMYHESQDADSAIAGPSAGRNIEVDDCAICIRSMGMADPGLVECARCGKRTHGKCMALCRKAAAAAEETAKCSHCRAPWETAAGAERGNADLAAYSTKHVHIMSLAELYPSTHEHIGRSGQGRGRGRVRRLGGRGSERGQAAAAYDKLTVVCAETGGSINTWGPAFDF